MFHGGHACGYLAHWHLDIEGESQARKYLAGYVFIKHVHTEDKQEGGEGGCTW